MQSAVQEEPKAMPQLTVRPASETDLSYDGPASRAGRRANVEPKTNFENGQDGRVKLPSLAHVKEKLTTREGWFGDYDFGYLCMPTLPFSVGKLKRRAKATPFYGVEDDMPVMLAIICGLQHALAMLAGVITPPQIFASSLALPPDEANQLIAVSLIASGLLSCLQMSRIPLPFTRGRYYFGTGLITTVGTSFATLSTASAIFNTMYADGTCPSSVVSGAVVRQACPQAYGALLGTSCLCSLVGMALSFLPPKTLKRIFPPIVTGVVVLSIGASLIGSSSFPAWAGGSGGCRSRPTTGPLQLCPSNSVPGPNIDMSPVCSAPKPLPWGDARFIGLGFLSWITIVLLEYFGSPVMRSASLVIGLAVGCIVAGATGYISDATIRSAPAITFLWVKTYPLSIHAPSIIPMMCVYVILATEATGDITGSSEASRQPVEGPLYESRVQGGILADGFNGLLSGLFMNAPVSIFAQNTGVIAITRCANRTAGYICAAFLVVFGVLAKISGVFLAIPAPVLGGVTTFLFASVAVSGIKILSMAKMTRRNRMILSAALSFAVGNLLVKDWTSYIFTYQGDNGALRGFMNALIIILSTPYLIGGIVACLLNVTLPDDEEERETEKVLTQAEDEDVESGRGVVSKEKRASNGSVDDEDIKEA